MLRTKLFEVTWCHLEIKWGRRAADPIFFFLILVIIWGSGFGFASTSTSLASCPASVCIGIVLVLVLLVLVWIVLEWGAKLIEWILKGEGKFWNWLHCFTITRVPKRWSLLFLIRNKYQGFILFWVLYGLIYSLLSGVTSKNTSMRRLCSE